MAGRDIQQEEHKNPELGRGEPWPAERVENVFDPGPLARFCGFQGLGRFAINYRAAFGESSSATYGNAHRLLE